jgi:hypothetical protein
MKQLILYTFGQEIDTHTTLKHINTQTYCTWLDWDSNIQSQYLNGQPHLLQDIILGP